MCGVFRTLFLKRDNLYKTRPKCKSSARVKIVLKKDWIVKKVEKCWKKCLKIFFEKIGKNQKKSEKIGKNKKKIIRNNQKNNQ